MKFKQIQVVIVSILLTVIISGCKKEKLLNVQNENTYKINFILGDVKISNSSGTMAAKQGTLLSLGDIVATGSKSTVDLVWGTNGIIRINENSNILIASIVDDKNKDNVLEMSKGKVLVILTKLKGTRFRIKTQTILASVRGTSFTVVSGKQGAKLSVVKGVVTINPVKQGNVIEEKYTDVETGGRTDYIDEKTVGQITASERQIPIVQMNDAEIIEIQKEIKEIKIEDISDLTSDLKEEIIESMVNNNLPEKKNITEKVKKETVLKRNEEEKKRVEEEEKAKKEAELNAPSTKLLR